MLSGLDFGTNSSEKIHIDKKGWSDERKRLFETKLGALLKNPNFLLLHVPEEKGTKMKIIQPSSDPYHRHRIIEGVNEGETTPRTWYALSHLWGITKADPHVWDNITQLVEDEYGQPVQPVSMRPEKRNTLLKLLEAYPNSYWWIDVLCARHDTPLDIMGDIYACCTECIALLDIDPEVIPEFHSVVDDATSLTMGDPQLCNIFGSLIDCKWWKRVWTWQEMALPRTILLMAENATQVSEKHMMNLDCLPGYLPIVFHGLYAVLTDFFYQQGLTHPLSFYVDLPNAFAIHGEVLFTRGTNSWRISADGLYALFLSFKQSSRQCMEPVDYVYGILGILRLDIPRMNDHHQVWKLFLSKLDTLMIDLNCTKWKISNDAHQVDLLAVENMADVYKDLLTLSDSEKLRMLQGM
ncbi:hypothetical protein O0I10_011485 [Lichtheimia ornata]|uniref:Heterokaryon incompatibility domain-containing protein n=1 Tax=Lichtheimia ornata TaxID=688661 RepID=A0AAD7UTE1_9FUNG|nr:uncharacterized protein O0I10_011485 [Lichtheimia ornata]KAJ8652885.1 hypothetical protein O0I10_011485 [Lichtheimia ornata]